MSDATPSVVDEQLRYEIGRQSFEIIDAGLPLDRVAASALDLIVVRARRSGSSFIFCKPSWADSRRAGCVNLVSRTSRRGE